MRPDSKFTPTCQAEIVGHVTGGKFRYEAAELCGVTERTLKRWMRKGREDLERHERNEIEEVGEFGLFVLAMIQGEAIATGKLIKLISKAAEDTKHWQAAAWLLERKNSRRFGSMAKMAIVSDENGNGGRKDYGRAVIGMLDALAERDEKIAKAAAEADPAEG